MKERARTKTASGANWKPQKMGVEDLNKMSHYRPCAVPSRRGSSHGVNENKWFEGGALNGVATRETYLGLIWGEA